MSCSAWRRVALAAVYLGAAACDPRTTDPEDGPPGPSWPGTALSVSAGDQVTCAIGSDNAQWCWGNTADYQFPFNVNVTAEQWSTACGNGFVLPAYVWPCVAAAPVRVGSLPLASLRISAAGAPPCGLDASATAWCWVDRRYVDLPATAVLTAAGYYDCNGVSCRFAPRRVKAPGPLRDYANVGFLGCAITTAGALHCMGGNGHGQLGNPSFPAGSYDSLVPVSPGMSFQSVQLGRIAEFACALATGGLAYCWGDDLSGQLGNGSFTQRNTPTAVSGARTYTALAVGSRHVCAIAVAGPTYCWGWGVNGILGNGSTASFGTPVLVSGNHNFTSITAGFVHTCALDGAGQAWCWGGDDRGQLGVDWNTSCPGASGVAHCSLIPAAVAGGLVFRQLSTSALHTCGVTTSSEVWCWGSASYGELGNGYSALRGTAVIHPIKVAAH